MFPFDDVIMRRWRVRMVLIEWLRGHMVAGLFDWLFIIISVQGWLILLLWTSNFNFTAIKKASREDFRVSLLYLLTLHHFSYKGNCYVFVPAKWNGREARWAIIYHGFAWFVEPLLYCLIQYHVLSIGMFCRTNEYHPLRSVRTQLPPLLTVRTYAQQWPLWWGVDLSTSTRRPRVVNYWVPLLCKLFP